MPIRDRSNVRERLAKKLKDRGQVQDSDARADVALPKLSDENFIQSTLETLFAQGPGATEKYFINSLISFMNLIGSDKKSFENRYSDFEKKCLSKLPTEPEEKTRYESKVKSLFNNNNDHSEFKSRFQVKLLVTMLTPGQLSLERLFKLLPSILETKPPYILLSDENGNTHVWEMFKINHFGNGTGADAQEQHAKYITTMDDEKNIFTKIMKALFSYSAETKLIERDLCDAGMNPDPSRLSDLADAAVFRDDDDLDIHYYVQKGLFPAKWADGYKNKDSFLKMLNDKALCKTDDLGEASDDFRITFLDDACAKPIEKTSTNVQKSVKGCSPAVKAALLASSLGDNESFKTFINMPGFCDMEFLKFVAKTDYAVTIGPTIQAILEEIMPRITDDSGEAGAAAPAPPYEVSELGGAAAAPAPYEAHELGSAAAIGEGDDGL